MLTLVDIESQLDGLERASWEVPQLLVLDLVEQLWNPLLVETWGMQTRGQTNDDTK